MTPLELERLARAWLDAFNARELPALLALYHQDALHLSPKLRQKKPETKGIIRGKENLAAWWEDAFRTLPGLRYEPVRLTTGHSYVIMEYTRRLPGEPDLDVAEFLEVENGLIARSRVFHG